MMLHVAYNNCNIIAVVVSNMQHHSNEDGEEQWR